MERIAERWADTLGRELNLDEPQREMLAYGLKILFSLVYSYSLTFFLAYLFGVWQLALVVIVTNSLLRSVSGGAHSSSPYICGIFGALLTSAIALLARNVSNISLIALFILIAVALYIVIRWVPAGNPKRPPPTPGKRRFFKMASTFLIVGWGFIFGLWKWNIICIPVQYVAASIFSIGWQLFTLTPVGYWSLGKLDAFFMKALRYNNICKGGE